MNIYTKKEKKTPLIAAPCALQKQGPFIADYEKIDSWKVTREGALGYLLPKSIPCSTIVYTVLIPRLTGVMY